MRFETVVGHPSNLPLTATVEANGFYDAICSAKSGYSITNSIPYNEVQAISIKKLEDEPRRDIITEMQEYRKWERDKEILYIQVINIGLFFGACVLGSGILLALCVLLQIGIEYLKRMD
jgi:hypothetical protein